MKAKIKARKRARIEMIPLIDCLFLLLAYFIYSMLAMTVHRGLTVDLPVSRTAELHQRPALEITAKADGTLYLDREAVGMAALSDNLRLTAQNRPDVDVLVFADKTLDFQQLFRILDCIRLAGLSRISLQAEARP